MVVRMHQSMRVKHQYVNIDPPGARNAALPLF
jgi:hypothetical protein